MDRKDEVIKIKGFNYGFLAERGDYASHDAVSSLKKLKETGTEWISLCLVVFQETYCSTSINFDYNKTPTDSEVSKIIEEAHKLGFKVCLKPMINSGDHIWRAEISFPDGGEYWDKWFYSYSGFLKHYAVIAEDTDCEMFSVGCEMIGTEHREKEWRNLIGDVRKLYGGPLIYNANHGKEDNINWWDTLDYLGTSAYYPVAQAGGASLDEMISNWERIKIRIKGIYDKYKKPIVFMEIGCRSASGCAAMPWDFEHVDLPIDQVEQARFYESCLKVFSDEPWFSGYFWWDWRHKLYEVEEAGENNDFAIYGKQAEQVIRKWWK